MENASNNDITLLRKLKLRKHREKEQLFIVEGERAVIQLLHNNLVEVKSVFIEERLLSLFDKYPEHKSKVKLLGREGKDHVFDTESPQGILAVCKMPEQKSMDEVFDGEGLIVAFDRIQDPGNAGTMMRTAAWFGVKAMIISKGSVDAYNPKVVRSTAGATGAVPIIAGELENIFEIAEEKGWNILLLDGGYNSESLLTLESTQKQILVIGNEANGVEKSLFKDHRKRVRIDGEEQEHVESLNAAIALGIGLFELTRL